mmetsp:Transcript_6825/g.20765  ORF Transcript_6825/g.20765 Transcript_6825/m.20765 type:complete len:90 (-) Transcript_6825:137-406(-)|eukprot:scaffold7709_cov32-Tisochrysis_lutea.AAC.3
MLSAIVQILCAIVDCQRATADCQSPALYFMGKLQVRVLTRGPQVIPNTRAWWSTTKWLCGLHRSVVASSHFVSACYAALECAVLACLPA